MSKFKVGDRVRVVVGGSGVSFLDVGKKTIVTEVGGKYAIKSAVKTKDFKNENYDDWIDEESFELAMTLKQRIEALNNGWDKEADNILQEIYESKMNTWYSLQIPCHNKEPNYKNSISIQKGETGCVVRQCYFTSQCSKNRAFKDALLWLLDKSGLEKEAKEGDCAEVEVDGKRFEAKLIRKL